MTPYTVCKIIINCKIYINMVVTCKENKILNFSWSKYKAPVKMIFSKWKAIKQKEIKKTKQNKTNKQKKEISINNANYAL